MLKTQYFKIDTVSYADNYYFPDEYNVVPVPVYEYPVKQILNNEDIEIMVYDVYSFAEIEALIDNKEKMKHWNDNDIIALHFDGKPDKKPLNDTIEIDESFMHEGLNQFNK